MARKTRLPLEGAYRDEHRTLAAPSLAMAAAVRSAIAMLGLDLHEVIRVASQYPANLALLDSALDVRRTWIDSQASG